MTDDDDGARLGSVSAFVVRCRRFSRPPDVDATLTHRGTTHPGRSTGLPLEHWFDSNSFFRGCGSILLRRRRKRKGTGEVFSRKLALFI